MNDRLITELYDMFVFDYGEDLDDVRELLDTLVIDFPDATNSEIVDFVTQAVIENHDEMPNIDDAVAAFSTVWGRKV
jgi:hypothetical protein